MKITKTYLRQVIKEELEAVLIENNQLNEVEFLKNIKKKVFGHNVHTNKKGEDADRATMLGKEFTEDLNKYNDNSDDPRKQKNAIEGMEDALQRMEEIYKRNKWETKWEKGQGGLTYGYFFNQYTKAKKEYDEARGKSRAAYDNVMKDYQKEVDYWKEIFIRNKVRNKNELKKIPKQQRDSFYKSLESGKIKGAGMLGDPVEVILMKKMDKGKTDHPNSDEYKLY